MQTSQVIYCFLLRSFYAGVLTEVGKGLMQASHATQMLTDRYKQLKFSVTSVVIVSRTIAHALNCSDR